VAPVEGGVGQRAPEEDTAAEEEDSHRPMVTERDG